MRIKLIHITMFFFLIPLKMVLSQDFVYSNFKKPIGLKLYGDAFIKNDVLSLTPSKKSQVGACYYADEKVFLQEGFETTFTFKITGSGPKKDEGADGFAFIINKAEDNVFMTRGQAHNIGYSDLSNSLAIEFDTCSNYFFEADNHVAVHLNGNSELKSEIAKSEGIQNIEKGETHTVKITYKDKTLKIYLNTFLIIDTYINIENTLNLEDGEAFIGFTSATGEQYATHSISSWSFENRKQAKNPLAKLEGNLDRLRPKSLSGRKITGSRIIHVKNKKVTFSVYDNGYEDGDIVSLNLNDTWILENYLLKRKEKKKIKVELPSETNYLISHAENLGATKPNTSAIIIDDGFTKQIVVLKSNKNQSESIIVNIDDE